MRDSQKAEAAIASVTENCHAVGSCGRHNCRFDDDPMMEEIKVDRHVGPLFEEFGCAIYHVISPEGHTYQVGVNWYPLWRSVNYTDHIVGIGPDFSDVGLRAVTISCLEDLGKQDDKTSCPCNGGGKEFYETLRAALVAEGLDVTDGLVNFEGA